MILVPGYYHAQGKMLKLVEYQFYAVRCFLLIVVPYS